MKWTPQRTLFELINFLLAVLFIIPLGVLIEQTCGYPLFQCCLIPTLSAIGYLMGRFSLHSSVSRAMLLSAVGLVSSTLLALFLSLGLGIATTLLTLLTAFFSLFFFFSARKAAYTIYAPMAIAGILIHLVVMLCCTGFNWGTRTSRFTSVVSICFFLLTLFAFSAKGLRRSLHRGSADKRVIYPAGMQMGNFLLVTGFILVAAFISNIYPIFRLFSKGFSVILKALVALLAFISSLFDRRTISTAGEEPQSAVEISAEDNIMAVEPKGEASWITAGVEIFAFICVMLFLGYAIFKLAKKLQTSGIRLPAFLRNLRNRFAPIQENDYVDESESLFDMKKMLSDTRENIQRALQKLRERQQKLDDFPDNRMKIRFTFQQILKRVNLRNPTAIAQTPNEIYTQEYDGEEDFREFMDYYNEAKYSQREIPDKAANCAREILKQKL